MSHASRPGHALGFLAEEGIKFTPFDEAIVVAVELAGRSFQQLAQGHGEVTAAALGIAAGRLPALGGADHHQALVPEKQIAQDIPGTGHYQPRRCLDRIDPGGSGRGLGRRRFFSWSCRLWRSTDKIAAAVGQDDRQPGMMGQHGLAELGSMQAPAAHAQDLTLAAVHATVAGVVEKQGFA